MLQLSRGHCTVATIKDHVMGHVTTLDILFQNIYCSITTCTCGISKTDENQTDRWPFQMKSILVAFIPEEYDQSGKKCCNRSRSSLYGLLQVGRGFWPPTCPTVPVGYIMEVALYLQKPKTKQIKKKQRNNTNNNKTENPKHNKTNNNNNNNCNSNSINK